MSFRRVLSKKRSGPSINFRLLEKKCGPIMALSRGASSTGLHTIVPQIPRGSPGKWRPTTLRYASDVLLPGMPSTLTKMLGNVLSHRWRFMARLTRAGSADFLFEYPETNGTESGFGAGPFMGEPYHHYYRCSTSRVKLHRGCPCASAIARIAPASVANSESSGEVAVNLRPELIRTIPSMAQPGMDRHANSRF